MNSYALGIDIGTQGIKSALIDNYGRVFGETLVESELISNTGGVVEQDPSKILEDVIHAINMTINNTSCNTSEILAISFAGQMAGILGIDEHGNAITPYDSWLDQRCGKYMYILHDLNEDKIIQTTGCPITYAHAPKILWWKYENPEIYKNVASFVQPAAYVAMKFAGLSAKNAFIDYTYLHFTGFADTKQKIWSDSLLKEAGIDIEKMPRIVKPWEIIGYVTKDFSELTGILSGTPIAAGCGDTAASILGAGITEPGFAIDVSGTASVFSVATNQFLPDTVHKTMIFSLSVLDNLYTPLAYVNGGGLCLKWIRDTLFNSEYYQYSYGELDDLAELVSAGSDNLLFIPHFNGRVCPNEQYMRGSWLGLNWHHKKAHLYRAAIESIGYEYKYYYDILKSNSPALKIEKVINVAGGSRSHLMKKIKGNILQVPWVTINHSDTGSIGLGVIAGFSVGLFDSIPKTISHITQTTSIIEPTEELGPTYDKMAQVYLKALTSLKPIFYDIIRPE